MSTLVAEQTQIPIATDEFNALEQRVLRMVELVRSEREARAGAEARVQTLEASVKSLEDSGLSAEQRVLSLEESLQQAKQKIAQLTEQSTHSTSQIESLEKERDSVRTRVEKLLRHLDEIPS
jgi:chromosome segregation ATPase